MTDQILFDRLIYMDRLKRAGISDDQARAHTEAMDEALREAVATQADITALRTDIRALERDLTIRFGSMLVVAVGVLLGFKFFG
jgi:hypothetical protein